MRRLILAAGLAAAVSPLSAQSLSSTITLASDYLFDGVSQTQGSDSGYINPALQASLDLSFENGFYVGTWASNVDFGSDDPAKAEIDLYAGYAWELSNGIGLDAGVAHYMYTSAPTDGYDYTEVYIGASFPEAGTGLTLYVADDDHVFGGGAWRLKGTYSFPINDVWSLDLEATRSQYESADLTNVWHGQVGVSRSAGPLDFYFGYSETNIQDNPAANGRFLFTISSTIEFF